MNQQVWQLHEAKNKLSEVIDHALAEGPQVITRQGVETAIILSYRDYRKLLSKQNKLSDFFRESPLAGVALDLRRDQSEWRNDVDL